MQFFRKPRQVLGFFLSITLITACATGSSGPKAGPPVSKSVILGQTRIPATAPKSPVNETALKQKMKRLQTALSRGAPLRPQDWRLHDELLNAYIQIKSQNLTANQIKIPAHSQLKLEFPSFCLNSSRASPGDSEHFIWRKADPKIPYYREILEYVVSHPKSATHEEIQTLLWNLQNETRWENYPDHLKAILQQIDPKASTKLPSKLKDTLKDTAADLITSHLPFGSDARDAIELVKGDYYRFEDVRRSIEQMKSNYPLEPSDELESIPDSPLYAETQSQGFSNQTVTFYNPSDQPRTIDLTDYYLEPKRKDVQRIALMTPTPENHSSGLLADLEKLLYGDLLRLGIGFTPGLNDIADAYELLLGKDFVTNEPLSGRERALSGLGLIIGSGAGYRYIQKAAYAPAEYLAGFERGLEKAGARAGLRIEQAEAKQALSSAEGSLAERRRVSKIRTYSAEEANREFPGYKPPYESGTQVTEFKTVEGDQWVRVHGSINQEGDWIVRKEAIKDLTAEEIRSKYSLRDLPTEISDVRPDVGTRIRRGRVEANFGGNRGSIQYQILDNRLPSWFSNRRSLNGR